MPGAVLGDAVNPRREEPHSINPTLFVGGLTAHGQLRALTGPPPLVGFYANKGEGERGLAMCGYKPIGCRLVTDKI